MEHRESPRPSRPPLFRLLRVVLFVLLALLAAVAGFVAYLSIAEFRPAAEQAAESVSEAYPGDAVALDTAYTVMSFNIGYAGLGEESDFFIDGGAQTRPSSAQIVQKTLPAYPPPSRRQTRILRCYRRWTAMPSAPMAWTRRRSLPRFPNGARPLRPTMSAPMCPIRCRIPSGAWRPDF